MAQLLLVEDDAEIRRALIRALSERGHVVASASTSIAAMQHVIGQTPDLVVLDLGLPDLDGRELLLMLRAVSKVPVVVATARDDEATLVEVLDRGADDYVVKPFSVTQLDARIRAVLRRAGAESAAAAVLGVGTLCISPGAREATLDGRLLDLTPREFDLLSYLAVRVGTVVTKRELLVNVWRQPAGGADKTVDVHLSWLRRKLGESAQQPRYLHTVRGVGVRLNAPAER
ncbi:response regulator transcription factor [Catellatospora chokoriensis]|uniref:response regulator transcription factor n=1 Tax=Catellatospora chokoriensis TaxID=310353 RepID=UPI001782F30D|nr:response regulator transcription factor [Catellatospora chokoriensis]